MLRETFWELWRMRRMSASRSTGEVRSYPDKHGFTGQEEGRRQLSTDEGESDDIQKNRKA